MLAKIHTFLRKDIHLVGVVRGWGAFALRHHGYVGRDGAKDL